MKKSLLAISALCCSVSVTTAQEKQPNIILIVVDDLGYADMSFLPFASKDVTSPGIDKLAKNGVYFSNAYATAPISSPSRAGLATGRYQQRWGNYWYSEGGLPTSEQTIAQALKNLGYYTKKIGKTHMNGGEAQHPLKHGFDEFFGFVDHTWDYLRLSQKDVEAYGEKNAKKAHIGPLERNGEKVSYEGRYTTELFTEEAIDFIDKEHQKPFFLQISYNAVHHPTYVGHPEYLEKYGLEQFPFWNPEEMEYGGGNKNKDTWHYKWGWLGEVDPDGRKRYLAALDVLDDGIANIMSKLDEKKLNQNTIIIFVSDNGGTINTYANNAPLHGYKYTFEEGGIRVPVIVSFPKMKKGKKGTTVNSMVSLMDIFPTLVEAAGGSLPKNIDGKSWLPLLKTKKEKTLHQALCWSSGKGDWVVRQGDWKLYRSKGKKFKNFKIEDGRCLRDVDYPIPSGTRLYNLNNDIGETKDLAAQYPEKVKELKKIYQDWRKNMANPIKMKHK